MTSALNLLEKQKKPRFIGLGSADFRALLFILVLTAIILLLPHLLRDTLIGREAYYYLRIAEEPLRTFDNLSYSGRTYIFNAWPLILSLSNLPLTFASKFLPYLFGLLSVLFFYLILKRFDLDLKTRILACIMLIISPNFIYLFSTSNSYLFPIFLSLLVLFLLLNRITIIAMLLIVTPLFNIASGIIASVLLLFYSVKEKQFKLLFVVLAIIFVILIKFFIYGLPESIDFRTSERGINFFIQSFISDLGGSFGFSIFSLVLVIFGLSSLWEKKYKNLIIYLTIIFLLLISFYQIKALFYLNFLFSLIAALGITKINEIKWESSIIRNLAIVVLSFGLMFSFIAYLNIIPDLPPSKSLVDSLGSLRKASNENDIVFSHYTKGFWINTIAKRKNVMDENFLYSPNVNERYKDSNELFYTRRIENATKIINKYNITYIFIDNKMKEGQVWSNNDEGLLFLLKSVNIYKKVYSNDEEIWRVR